MIGSLTFL